MTLLNSHMKVLNVNIKQSTNINVYCIDMLTTE
jgi:hypothetical protein